MDTCDGVRRSIPGAHGPWRRHVDPEDFGTECSSDRPHLDLRRRFRSKAPIDSEMMAPTHSDQLPPGVPINLRP
jgi:hypothetical protein